MKIGDLIKHKNTGFVLYEIVEDMGNCIRVERLNNNNRFIFEKDKHASLATDNDIIEYLNAYALNWSVNGKIDIHFCEEFNTMFVAGNALDKEDVIELKELLNKLV